MNEIGKYIKFYREAEHISQSQLAEKLGVSQRNVSYYESGERIPPADVLKKIATFLNVSIDVMLGLKEPRTDLKDYRNDFSEDDDKSSEKETLTLEEKTVLRHFHKDPENVMLLLESFGNLDKRERIIIVGKCLELEKSESVAAEQPLKAAK